MSDHGDDDGSGGRSRSALGAMELVEWLLAGIVVAILGAYAYQYVYPGGAQGLVGGEAPSFEARQLGSDDPVSLEDYRGDVLVIDFWATWCPPCHQQFEYLRKFERDPELPENVSILLVNTDEPSGERIEKVRRYLTRRKLPYDTVLDDGTVRRTYGVDSFPTLVVVGPDGTIEFAEPGVHGTEEMVEIVKDASE